MMEKFFCESTSVVSVLLIVLSVLLLLAGCLFLVFDLTLWRTKIKLDMRCLTFLDDEEIHDRTVEELERVHHVSRISRRCYIVFFTLALMAYTSFTYMTKKDLSFDLLAFCISVVVTVPTTLFLSWFGRTTTFMMMRYSYYLEFLFGLILAVLWIATLFFFFYLFPWIGCITAVLFIFLGIGIIRFMNKYGNKNVN